MGKTGMERERAIERQRNKRGIKTERYGGRDRARERERKECSHSCLLGW